MSSVEATRAKGPASPVISTMAGAAPRARRTLAVMLVTTALVMQEISGAWRRTASSAAGVDMPQCM